MVKNEFCVKILTNSFEIERGRRQWTIKKCATNPGVAK